MTSINVVFAEEGSNSLFLLILVLTLVLILTLTIWIFFYRLRPRFVTLLPEPEAASADLEIGGGRNDPPPAYPGLLNGGGGGVYSICLEDHLQPPPSYQSVMDHYRRHKQHFVVFAPLPPNLSLPKYLADNLQCPQYSMAAFSPPAPASESPTTTEETPSIADNESGCEKDVKMAAGT